MTVEATVPQLQQELHDSRFDAILLEDCFGGIEPLEYRRAIAGQTSI